jgi:hypothetical protein
LSYLEFEDIVHHTLERGRRVAESKEHNGQFKESFLAYKCGFSFISFAYANIVVSPVNVHLRKEFLSNQTIDEVVYSREGVSIADGP